MCAVVGYKVNIEGCAILVAALQVEFTDDLLVNGRDFRLRRLSDDL